MQSCTGCICLVFPHCAISNVHPNVLPDMTHSYTGCICMTFLHCVFLNAPSNCMHERTHCHTDCIGLTFPHYVFSNVSSNGLPERMHIYTGCICLFFLRCVLPNVSSKHMPAKMHYHIGYIFWLFSAVCFQMSPHIVCPSGRKATLVALVFPLTLFCHSHASFCFIIVFMRVKMLKILIHHNSQVRRRRDECWTSALLIFWLFQILTK